MKRKSSRKFLKKTFISLIILGLLFLHFYVPRIITEIKNPLIEFVKQKRTLDHSPTFALNSKTGKQINYKSFDQIELSAYLTYSTLDSVKGSIILLHGIRSKKEHFIPLSRKLANLGYHTIAFDSRAHGQSGGIHCTFGVKEKKDIHELINILQKKENIKENIGIWGQSLGAAIGLQAMDFDQRIKFGIIESTFTDFNTITHDYVNYHLGFNINPLTNYLIYRAGQIADFDPNEAKPSESCKNIRQAVLIVHGNEDKRIDIKYAKENFSNIKTTNKEFVEIKNANHLNVWEVGADDYFNKVISFLEKEVGN